MSLTAYTTIPRTLLKAIREAIEDGSIDTWETDADGDFTHSTAQWRMRAWMRVANIEPKESITFGIIGRRGTNVTSREYAIYHGRFAEMLLSHFDGKFKRIVISALANKYDNVSGEKR